ncbi:MAG TPA: TonB-dependent receptor [Bryobacteraceae bacterium]|jgi:hypothetical protein
MEDRSGLSRGKVRSLRARSFAQLTLLLILLPLGRAQTCAPGEIRVIVIDSQESPVYNAQVSLSSDGAQPVSRSTQTSGLADFPGLPCGAWNVSIEAAGFQMVSRAVEIASAGKLEIRVVLTPKIRVESVEVKESAASIAQSSSQNYELKPAEVQKLPTNPATVNDVLPLVPGVVRDQTGELKIDGSGQERSAMVVNQTDITDPATGRFGQSVPLDSIETVNVLQTPFLAQYGRFTQSVVAVETKRGGEKWHADLNDPFPDFRIRSFHMRGIRDESPRFVGDGPLVKDRVFISSALQYYFRRDSDRTLPFPYNESRREALNSFTQLDWILTPRHFMTATMHVSPQHTNFVDPNYFNPQPVTPSYAQHNYAGTLIDHFGLLGGIVDSSVSVQRFDVNVGAQGGGDMIVTPTGNQGNFFGTQNRDARRQEWLETWSLAPFNFLGAHLLKLGTSLTGSSDQGQFSYHDVDILNAQGVRTQRIDFSNQLPYDRADLEVTAYVQDHWSPVKKVSFDYGGRIEHQRLATSLRIAPRGGISWSPFANARTVLRAGYGLFYDHLPLDIYTFGRYPLRTITDYAPDGSIVDGPTPYANVIGSVTGPRSFFINGQQVAGAFSPRGATLSLQVEHSLSTNFRLRAVYTDNQSVGLIVFEPDALGRSNEIVLNGDGKSRYQQAEVTARYSWKEDQQVVFSYTRSRAKGNLNTFDSFLGNLPTLIVRPNISSNLPADLPNRFVVWGTLNTHVWGLQVLPLIEYHTGFPYARLDAAQNYVGVPYSDATRFPKFFQADARVMRDFKVSPKYAVRLSLTVTNFTNHFNALQIHNNTADPQSGIFFGNYDRRYRGDFDIIF